MAHRTIKLNVINDLACAFCYIGHQELQNAMAACRDLPVDFDVHYSPFKLMNIPEGTSMSKDAFHLMNKIPIEKRQMQARAMKVWADKLGLNLSFEGVYSSTTNAHRLSMKAYQLGGQHAQLAVISLIFKAVCEQARDISNLDVLAEIAERSGLLSRSDALKFLQSSELRHEVTKMASDAKASGVKGIPVVIVDSKWVVSGCQTSDVYIQIFKKLAATEVHEAPSPFPSHIAEAVLV